MKIRELTADEQTACWIKATQKVDQLLSSLQELPEDKKYDGLYQAFLAATHVQKRCSENFVGNDFLPKNDEHVQRSEDEILDLRRTDIKAKAVMQGLVKEMSKLSLARVNGTSLIFCACAEKAGLDPNQLLSSNSMPFQSNITLPELAPAAYK